MSADSRPVLGLARWRSYHLHYHADRNRLLTDLAQPLLDGLLADALVDGFFFVRFALGGPHVRLRLRIARGALAAVTARVTTAADRFFCRWPSAVSLSAPEIARHNRVILAEDPGEHDAGVYPDSSLRIGPFTPETERYGGATLFGASLACFALSSWQALDLLAAHGSDSWASQLPHWLVLLARSAAALARDESELLSLLSYASPPTAAPWQRIADRADRAFEQYREPLCELLRASLTDRDVDSPAFAPLACAYRRLNHDLAGAAPEARRRILVSHLHMTANRVGLDNPHEAYLGRILERAAHQVAVDDPVAWAGVGSRLAQRAAPPESCQLLLRRWLRARRAAPPARLGNHRHSRPPTMLLLKEDSR